MSALSYVDAVRDRLEAELAGPGGFEGVHTALDFAGADFRISRTPAAVVIPAADTGGENRASHGALQSLTTTIAVAVAVPVRNDPRGERALDEITPRVDAVRNALIGWSPPGGPGALRFLRGSLAGIDPKKGRAWWEDVYEFRRMFSAIDGGRHGP